MHELKTPVAVVAHDAGAANLIIAWLKAWNEPVRAYMQGPAARLWEKAFPTEQLCISLKAALEGASSLISGTGWASSLEHEARVHANKIGLYSVAVLDHYVNYSMRFERDALVQWPNEIWVVDKWALRITQVEIPHVPVRLFENLYLKNQLARIGKAPGNGTALYVLEPVRQTWGRNQAGEFQALEFALEHIDRLCLDRVTNIILRTHPSESSTKYVSYLTFDSRIRMDSDVDLNESISKSDLVLGVESMALVTALAASRHVYSSLPPWAPPLRLPQLGIKQIRDLC